MLWQCASCGTKGAKYMNTHYFLILSCNACSTTSLVGKAVSLTFLSSLPLHGEQQKHVELFWKHVIFTNAFKYWVSGFQGRLVWLNLSCVCLKWLSNKETCNETVKEKPRQQTHNKTHCSHPVWVSSQNPAMLYSHCATTMQDASNKAQSP